MEINHGFYKAVVLSEFSPLLLHRKKKSPEDKPSLMCLVKRKHLQPDGARLFYINWGWGTSFVFPGETEWNCLDISDKKQSPRDIFFRLSEEVCHNVRFDKPATSAVHTVEKNLRINPLRSMHYLWLLNNQSFGTSATRLFQTTTGDTNVSHLTMNLFTGAILWVATSQC